MVKNITYPNYVDYYYYTKKTLSIKVERKIRAATIYKKYLEFDTPEEAYIYFNDKCGTKLCKP